MKGDCNERRLSTARPRRSNRWMVDAVNRRWVSDSRVDRVPGDEFRPSRVVPSAAWPLELGCAPESRALGHRRVEDLHLAVGAGGRVAHALGSTAEKAGVLSCWRPSGQITCQNQADISFVNNIKNFMGVTAAAASCSLWALRDPEAVSARGPGRRRHVSLCDRRFFLALQGRTPAEKLAALSPPLRAA